MTLEMLADNRIEFVRKFITEDRGQFAKTVQEYVDGKEKKPFSLEEAVDLAKEFRSSITREEVWQVVSEDQVSSSKSDTALFLQSDNKITLQGWMFELYADSEREEGQEAMAEVVTQQLREKHR